MLLVPKDPLVDLVEPAKLVQLVLWATQATLVQPVELEELAQPDKLDPRVMQVRRVPLV